MKSFSVIIPTYNRANLIVKCIKSVINSCPDETEIIVVDDGSTDDTQRLILSLNNNKIHYYKKANEGVSCARNYGISKASNDYIIFLDSDDTIDGTIFKLAEKADEDLVISGLRDLGKRNKIIKETRPRQKQIVTRQYYKTVIMDLLHSGLLNTCTGKIFSRKIINTNKVGFNKDICYGEDLRFVLDYIKATKTINIDTSITYYVNRSDSFLSTKYIDKKFDLIVDNINYLATNINQFGVIFNEDELSERYFSAIKAGINNLFLKDCTLSRDEKISEISHIVNSKYAIKSLQYIKKKQFLYYHLLNTKKINTLYLIHKLWQVVK